MYTSLLWRRAPFWVEGFYVLASLTMSNTLGYEWIFNNTYFLALMLACFLFPMLLSGFTAGQGGMRMTWQQGSEVTGSALGSGTGILFHIRGQEKGLVTLCQQITALNHNLHLADKSLSSAARSSKDHSQTRKHQRGSILGYWPWGNDKEFISNISCSTCFE